MDGVCDEWPSHFQVLPSHVAQLPCLQQEGLVLGEWRENGGGKGWKWEDYKEWDVSFNVPIV